MYVQNPSSTSVWEARWDVCNRMGKAGWGWLWAALTIGRHEEVWAAEKLNQQAHIIASTYHESGCKPRPNWKAHCGCCAVRAPSKYVLPRHSWVCLCCGEQSHQVAAFPRHQHLDSEGGRRVQALTFPTSAQSETTRADTCSRNPYTLAEALLSLHCSWLLFLPTSLFISQILIPR